MPTLTFLNTRKGKLIAVGTAAAIALATAGVLWETAPQKRDGNGQSLGRFDTLTKLGSEAIDALEARSPGPRIGGIALKGKGKRARALPRERLAKAKPKPAPTEKALGKIFYPSEFALNSVPAALPGLPSLDFAPPVIGGGAGSPFVPGTPGGGGFVFVPPGGGGGSPPPTGGGGGGTPPPPPPPPSAVPEPATWLLMIIGFGVIGGALRRKKATLLAV